MALTLTYTAKTTIPVEVETLMPELLREKSVAEIEKQLIQHGNTQVPVAEFFKVDGDANDNSVVFVGDLSGVHWIGAKMSEGSIRVDGPAGRHVGTEMTGGEIVVNGNASDWVGGEMHGGFIHIKGNAGHLIGAAYRGSAKGMTKGTILIDGNVGNEVGHTMRRGMIAVGGACGDFVGLNMIAGSVFVFGACGIRPAAGMKRGTVALFGDAPPILSTFRKGGPIEPQFMRLYLISLARRGFHFDPNLLDAAYDIYHGDLVANGRGELLVRSRN